MAQEKREVLLIITDISGYTSYMLSNKMSLEHSQMAISALTEAIIEEVEIPLHVAKLEGDAIFMYANISEDRDAICRAISEKLDRFFQAFTAQIRSLIARVECSCGACKNISKLRLKLVAHTGEALFYRIGEFMELAGVDVILVHKMLKVPTGARHYMLITDLAQEALGYGSRSRMEPFTIELEGFGAISSRLVRHSFPKICME